jgi:murein DD-endopeptidase MepM/ murein hydrolase activator NlpD
MSEEAASASAGASANGPAVAAAGVSGVAGSGPGLQAEERLRPLPSVDIPILREHRRASRQRQLALAAGVALLGVAGGAAAWALTSGDARSGEMATAAGPAVPEHIGARDAGPDAEGDPSGAATPAWRSAVPGAPAGDLAARGRGVEPGARPPAIGAPIETPSPDDDAARAVGSGEDEGAAPRAVDDFTPSTPGATTRRTVAFGRAGGFQPALLAAGCSREEAQALTDALARVIDFRRCRPEDQLGLERSADGVLLRFEYTADRTHVYEALRRADGRFVGRRVEVPIERVRIARGGYVSGSLGEALEHNGLGRSLVTAFVDAFGAKVNFGTQTRAGDSFRVIVEEERVGGERLRSGRVHALEYTGGRTGTLRAFYYAPGEGDGDYYDETGRGVHGGWLRTPVAFDRISSPFDPRRMHPVLRRVMPHNGIDYAAPPGTPVWAAAEGTVTFAAESGANGNLIAIAHADGYESYYAHLLRFERGIRVGVTVRQRQVVGYVGSTGRSTGPHLHFGLRKGGQFVDPARHLNGPGRLMAASALPGFRRVVRALTAELARIPLAPAPATTPRSPAGPEHDFHGEGEEEIALPARGRPQAEPRRGASPAAPTKAPPTGAPPTKAPLARAAPTSAAPARPAPRR